MMLKILNKEHHNSDEFSEYCLSFHFQPARPLSDKDSQTALPNTVDSPEDSTTLTTAMVVLM